MAFAGDEDVETWAGCLDEQRPSGPIQGPAYDGAQHKGHLIPVWFLAIVYSEMLKSLLLLIFILVAASYSSFKVHFIVEMSSCFWMKFY